MPTVVSLFSGVGGFDIGLERAGFAVIAQVENDAFCQRVLARRWPGVRRFDDVRGMGREVEESRGSRRITDARSAAAFGQQQSTDFRVNLLVGGFPCQDLSVAGKRAGLAGSRSGLFYEYVRIAKALAPTWGLVENVPGLLSSNRGRDFWCVLQGLRECWPAVGWRVVDSQHFGVPQRRRRVFLVGGPTEAGVAQVLALTEGGGGDPAAGGEAGARVAGAAAYSSTGLGYWRDGIGPIRERDYKGGDQNVIAFDPTTSLDQAPNDRTSPPLKVGTGLASMPWAPAILELAHRGAQMGGFPGPRLPSMIRRLTPLECERLQGFPDGWTCLDQPLLYAADPDAAALACRCPDSPRYRAMGNAVTVPVITWIGRRLLHAMKGTP